jgi:cyclase
MSAPLRPMRPRVIPVLLLSGDGLVKTVKFDSPKYIGDPINAMKIFNDSEVDELVLLDITSGRAGQPPQFAKLSEIISEAFMPVSYGGAVREMAQVEKLFSLGVEKIVFNTAIFENPVLLTQVAKSYGNQSVVASMDIKTNFWGRSDVFVDYGRRPLKTNPVDHAKKMQDLGAGEIFLNSIDRDGTRSGYDLALIEAVSNAVTIPVVACGGANELKDFRSAIYGAGASAVAAGSMFVFHGKLRGVLINYPAQQELKELFQSPI